MNEKRIFNLGTLLTLTTGKYLTEMMTFRDFIKFLTNEENITDYALIASKEICIKYILDKFPKLSEVNPQEINTDNWESWLNEQIKIYGNEFELTPIPSFYLQAFNKEKYNQEDNKMSNKDIISILIDFRKKELDGKKKTGLFEIFIAEECYEELIAILFNRRWKYENNIELTNLEIELGNEIGELGRAFFIKYTNEDIAIEWSKLDKVPFEKLSTLTIEEMTKMYEDAFEELNGRPLVKTPIK